MNTPSIGVVARENEELKTILTNLGYIKSNHDFNCVVFDYPKSKYECSKCKRTYIASLYESEDKANILNDILPCKIMGIGTGNNNG